MALTTWQLIAAMCCLLLAKTGSVLSKTFSIQQNSQQIGGSSFPSYTPALDFERKVYPALGEHGPASDLATPFGAASAGTNFPTTNFDNADQRLQQPKVYQSTVSRSVGPARQASNVQASTATTAGDLSMAAGHHHGHHHHGKYYEYREVPEKKAWKFGYKRGNHKHHIERHEHGKAGKHPHFKTKVKWADKKSKGKGIHLWDYNHHDKKHYGHHHGR